MRNTAGAIAMAIAVTGMFGTASTVAYADQEGTVNTSVLNVRSGPSTSNSCVGTVKLNTKVTILGTEMVGIRFPLTAQQPMFQVSM